MAEKYIPQVAVDAITMHEHAEALVDHTTGISHPDALRYVRGEFDLKPDETPAPILTSEGIEGLMKLPSVDTTTLKEKRLVYHWKAAYNAETDVGKDNHTIAADIIFRSNRRT